MYDTEWSVFIGGYCKSGEKLEGKMKSVAGGRVGPDTSTRWAPWAPFWPSLRTATRCKMDHVISSSPPSPSNNNKNTHYTASVMVFFSASPRPDDISVSWNSFVMFIVKLDRWFVLWLRKKYIFSVIHFCTKFIFQNNYSSHHLWESYPGTGVQIQTHNFIYYVRINKPISNIKTVLNSWISNKYSLYISHCYVVPVSLDLRKTKPCANSPRSPLLNSSMYILSEISIMTWP